MAKKITLPLTEELAKTLHAGDQVLLTGTIYTSRDAGHKRMCEALAKGEKIPFDPTDATIYYVGPTTAKPGQVIGVREKSRNLDIIAEAVELSNFTPEYLTFNKDNLEVTFDRLPERSELNADINEQLIVEFYSR